jgi:1-acyl-sn-glycerol-3-phosphate acyltransferase
MGLRYKLTYLLAGKILYFIYWLITRVKIEGLENIPTNKPVILISNHIRNLDAPCPVFACIKAKRYPSVLAKDTLWKIPILKHLWSVLGFIPVKRNTKEASNSLFLANKKLANCECLIIFPEGTTAKVKNKSPLKFKTGAARLALAHPKTIIIPAAQDFINGKLFLQINPPIKYSKTETVEQLTNKMYKCVDKLLTEIRNKKIDTNKSFKRCCG